MIKKSYCFFLGILPKVWLGIRNKMILIYRYVYYPLFNYLGVRKLCRMFFTPENQSESQPKYRKPSSLAIWILGVLFAVFGSYVAYYEVQTSVSMAKANSVTTNCASRFNPELLSNITNMQWKKRSIDPIDVQIKNVNEQIANFIFNPQKDAVVDRQLEELSNHPALNDISDKDAAEILRDAIIFNKDKLDHCVVPFAWLADTFIGSMQLEDTDFYACRFENTEFSSINLDGCRLDLCNFSNSILLNFNSKYTVFNNSFLYNVFAPNFTVEEGNFHFSCFDNSVLHRAKFDSVGFIMCSFANANLRHAQFYGATFIYNCSFKGADLSFARINFDLENDEDIKALASMLSEAKSLYKAQMDERVKSKLIEVRPDLFQYKPIRNEYAKQQGGDTEAFKRFIVSSYENSLFMDNFLYERFFSGLDTHLSHLNSDDLHFLTYGQVGRFALSKPILPEKEREDLTNFLRPISARPRFVERYNIENYGTKYLSQIQPYTHR